MLAQAVKVGCYVFDGVNAQCLPWLGQEQHCHHRCVIVIVIVMSELCSKFRRELRSGEFTSTLLLLP
jgi:hypothetical protein